jgi:hypothetical protein
VCHSLSEAESCGLVHRDIKPANIFLCRYGEDHDFVKVLDFGIVKATAATSETGPVLTRELTVHGTPAFMAPEQAAGSANVDGRADIYATGCVAYWLRPASWCSPTPRGPAAASRAPRRAIHRTHLPIRGARSAVLCCWPGGRRPQSRRHAPASGDRECRGVDPGPGGMRPTRAAAGATMRDLMRALVAALGVMAPTSPALAAQDAVPVHREPRHRLVWEDGPVRVLDVQVPPGDTSLYHIHDAAILYVPIAVSPIDAQPRGGRWIGVGPLDTSRFRVGRVVTDTQYVVRPLTHRVANVGPGLFRLIAVVNGGPGDPAPADSTLPGQLETGSSWFGQSRLTLAAAPALRYTSPDPCPGQAGGEPPPSSREPEGGRWRAGPGVFPRERGSGCGTAARRTRSY